MPKLFFLVTSDIADGSVTDYPGLFESADTKLHQACGSQATFFYIVKIRYWVNIIYVGDLLKYAYQT